MLKQVLISIGEKDLRVAILEDGLLAELFIEKKESSGSHGNIYKGRIEGVVPGLQAAFVDIGHEKNAFMHFDDILPETIPGFTEEEPSGGKKGDRKKAGGPVRGRRRFDRHDIVAKRLRVGQEMLVQVIKEPISTKGPRITSAISLPGRFLVMLPFESQNGGISKKVEDRQERTRLRKILDDIRKKNKSFIIRTAGVGHSSEAIMNDVEQLDKSWRALMRKQAKSEAPALLHDDQDILYRLTRDIFTDDIDEIWIDAAAERNKLNKLLKAMIPSLLERTDLYKDRKIPLFDAYDVERQIRRALRRKVWLKSGGYLIFDEMEALTAIDVNSGKYTGKGDQAKMILKTNLEAVHMVARQLRLRDIGGLIVVDLIDMDKEENRRSVRGEFQALLRRDRARISISAISEFGLVEMTRQRVRRSLRKQLFHDCPHCQGEGMILNDYEVWRKLYREVLECLQEAPRPHLDIRCNPDLVDYVEGEMREPLDKLERLYRINIRLLPVERMDLEEFTITEIEKPGAKKRPSAAAEDEAKDETKDKTKDEKKQPQRSRRKRGDQDEAQEDQQAPVTAKQQASIDRAEQARKDRLERREQQDPPRPVVAKDDAEERAAPAAQDRDARDSRRSRGRRSARSAKPAEPRPDDKEKQQAAPEDADVTQETLNGDGQEAQKASRKRRKRGRRSRRKGAPVTAGQEAQTGATSDVEETVVAQTEPDVAQTPDVSPTRKAPPVHPDLQPRPASASAPVQADATAPSSPSDRDVKEDAQKDKVEDAADEEVRTKRSKSRDRRLRRKRAKQRDAERVAADKAAPAGAAADGPEGDKLSETQADTIPAGVPETILEQAPPAASGAGEPDETAPTPSAADAASARSRRKRRRKPRRPSMVSGGEAQEGPVADAPSQPVTSDATPSDVVPDEKPSAPDGATAPAAEEGAKKPSRSSRKRSRKRAAAKSAQQQAAASGPASPQSAEGATATAPSGAERSARGTAEATKPEPAKATGEATPLTEQAEPAAKPAKKKARKTAKKAATGKKQSTAAPAPPEVSETSPATPGALPATETEAGAASEPKKRTSRRTTRKPTAPVAESASPATEAASDGAAEVPVKKTAKKAAKKTAAAGAKKTTAKKTAAAGAKKTTAKKTTAKKATKASAPKSETAKATTAKATTKKSAAKKATGAKAGAKATGKARKAPSARAKKPADS